MLIARFEDLEVWKEARKLTVSVYEITRAGALGKDFGLRDQMQRAAVSSMANIAEGYGRGGRIEFARFLNIAHASALELQSHFYVAQDLEYVTAAQFKQLYAQSESVRRLIGGLINYLKNPKQK